MGVPHCISRLTPESRPALRSGYILTQRDEVRPRSHLDMLLQVQLLHRLLRKACQAKQHCAPVQLVRVVIENTEKKLKLSTEWGRLTVMTSICYVEEIFTKVSMLTS